MFPTPLPDLLNNPFSFIPDSWDKVPLFLGFFLFYLSVVFLPPWITTSWGRSREDGGRAVRRRAARAESSRPETRADTDRRRPPPADRGPARLARPDRPRPPLSGTPTPAGVTGSNQARPTALGRGMWLRFRRGVDVTHRWRPPDALGPPGAGDLDLVEHYPAGQVVRVLEMDAPDDGLRYEPTIRAVNHTFVVCTEGAVWFGYTAFREPGVSPHGLRGEVVEELRFPGTPEDLPIALNRSHEEMAFWAAMAAAPQDDLPRLIYADFLDDRGDTAAGILRERRPFVLHYWVEEGGSWGHRNSRSASWGLAVAELWGFAAAVTGCRINWAAGDLGAFALCGFVTRRRSSSGPAGPEVRCLTVALDPSNAPLPPLVNYLLLRLAVPKLGELIRPQP
jgi:uncharacterized protein (TIGR02996 family)